MADDTPIHDENESPGESRQTGDSAGSDDREQRQASTDATSAPAPGTWPDSAERGPKKTPITAVRYGKMNHIGEFTHPANLKYEAGGKVVISTHRGIELGEHVSLTCPKCGKNSVSREKVESYAAESQGDHVFRFRNGRILRAATDADVAEFHHIEGTDHEKLSVCRKFADNLGLNMKIIECEQLLGGERVIFYFMSEERVDFRQLVRELASEFQTRIEMRQVGARDEARLLADYETCGRECCCKNFLKDLKPVGMAMAKLQKTTLDVAKVSGRCGRLKCCLRYEQSTYQELDKELPRNGSWIETPEGIGRVIERHILTQLVKIRTQEGRVMAVPVEAILARNLEPPPPPKPDESGGREGGRRPRRERGSRPGSSRSKPKEETSEPPDTSGDVPPERPAEETSCEPENKPPGEPEGQEGRKESSQRRRRGRRSRRGRRRGGPDRPTDPPPGPAS